MSDQERTSHEVHPLVGVDITLPNDIDPRRLVKLREKLTKTAQKWADRGCQVYAYRAKPKQEKGE